MYLFDLILTWWDLDTRRRGILRLARVLEDVFTASGLMGPGYLEEFEEKRALEDRTVDESQGDAVVKVPSARAAVEERATEAKATDDARGGDVAWADVPFNGTPRNLKETQRREAEAEATKEADEQARAAAWPAWRGEAGAYPYPYLR